MIHADSYFGDLMHHSLSSVNQVRSYDVPLWENPCDPYQKLSIEAGDSVIEMQAEGIVTFVDARSPMVEELKTLPHIEIISSAPWRLHEATYQLYSLGVEYLDHDRILDAVRTSSCVVPSDVPSVHEATWQAPWRASMTSGLPGCQRRVRCS